jgi:ABC-2 type transport system ATP-binding protein
VDADGLEPALRSLVEAGVRSLVSQPPSLEELFLRHYAHGGGTHGAAARSTEGSR